MQIRCLIIAFCVVFAGAFLNLPVAHAQNYGAPAASAQNGASARKSVLGEQIRRRQALSNKGQQQARPEKKGFFLPGGQIRRSRPINGRQSYLQRRDTIKRRSPLIQGYKDPSATRSGAAGNERTEPDEPPAGIAPPAGYFDDDEDTGETRKAGIDKNGKPEFQNQYQDYLKDLEEIRKDGKGPRQWDVDKDLMEMSTDERIAIDKEYNARNNPETEFNETLDNILNGM